MLWEGIGHSSPGGEDPADRPPRERRARVLRGIDRERWNREALDGAVRVDRLKPRGYVGKRDRALVAGAVHQEQPRGADVADGREQESETFVRPGLHDKRPLYRLTRDDSALERIDDDEGMTPRTPLDEDENAPFRRPGEGGLRAASTGNRRGAGGGRGRRYSCGVRRRRRCGVRASPPARTERAWSDGEGGERRFRPRFTPCGEGAREAPGRKQGRVLGPFPRKRTHTGDREPEEKKKEQLPGPLRPHRCGLLQARQDGKKIERHLGSRLAAAVPASRSVSRVAPARAAAPRRRVGACAASRFSQDEAPGAPAPGALAIFPVSSRT